jgi:hypothetical protein
VNFDELDLGNAVLLDEPDEIVEWNIDIWRAPKIGSTRRMYKDWYIVAAVETVPAILTLPDGSTIEVPGASCHVTFRLINEEARQSHRQQTPAFKRVRQYY